ncbi:MAG TPA: hypothetical protein VJT31_25835 [Rugosimonospora sp.]|nr:hypothetical protein [Rugosimonospora sp.]
MIRTGVKYLLAAAVASALGLTWMAPANADTVTSTTTCTNPFTAAQAGPSSFDVGIPPTAAVGDTVQVTVAFTFTNNSGFDLSDLNTFSQTIATTGTATNPVTVTAGSQGALANGSSVTVTESGTWTADEAGTATFTLGTFTFDIVAFGITVPVSCTYDSTPAAVSTVVS